MSRVSKIRNPNCKLSLPNSLLPNPNRSPFHTRSGHAHQSGYTVDENNVHYIVLHGIIETNPDQDAYSTVTITQTRMIVEGRGSEQCLDLPLRKSIESSSETSAELTEEISEATNESEKFSEYEDQLPASCVSVEVSV